MSNTDPTGMWTLGEMLGALNVRSILDGATGLNYWLLFNMLSNASYAIQFAHSLRALVTGMVAGNLRDVVLALANGTVAFSRLLGICQYGMALQILVKAVAAYGAYESLNAFMKAYDDDDVGAMIMAGIDIALDVITIFAPACFDGDTLVAAEDGFKRIDEIQVGDRVWSYNVETGEKKLKEVKQVFVEESNEILHLETTKGRINATTNHPLYVTGKGWVAAGDLVVDNEIHTLDGTTGTVTGFRLEKTDQPVLVYNLEVEDFQSYFVGGGVLVHNKCDKLSNKKADQVAQSFGYTNAEDLKEAYVGSLGGQFNTTLGTLDKGKQEVILEKIKDTTIKIYTELFYEQK